MLFVSQFLTVLAFIIVSAVVNDLETTTTRVVSASRPSTWRAKSTGSTLATNFKVRPLAAFLQVESARNAS